jgi:folate-binding protein YgfZ
MNFPTSSAVFWWKPAAWLRVTGADAANFLQGQFSNDLRADAAGGAIYGLWLNVKGKVVADSFVLRRGTGAADGDEFWIGSYFSAGAAIREKLESFIIADDVAIEDVTGEWAGVTLIGDGVEAAFAQGGREGFVFRGRRGAGENMEWVFPAAHADVVRAQLKAHREIPAEEMARRRIEAGIPSVPADIGPADLPNEGGLDEVAISYTKGCYLGQEVIARLKSLGQVRRRLVQVVGAGGEIPVLPAGLFAGARPVGELRSAVRDGAGGFVGLAMVTLMQVDAQSALAFAPDVAPTVRLISPP